MPDFAKIFSELFPRMLDSSVNTIFLFVFTLLFAIPLGLPVMLMAISRFWPFRWIANIYIYVLRGTPLMLQLFFFYYILPIIGGQMFMLDGLTTAVITFSINYSAYFAEIYRGGVQSVDKGQHEAAKTLGFTRWQTMRYVIIPQTVRRVLPSISNEAITLIKDTSLIYVISVIEIIGVGKYWVNDKSDPWAYALAACFYLFFTFILTITSRKLEKIFSKHEG